VSKTTYQFKEGIIFRRGEEVGHYDEETNAITSLREDLPKQIRGILGNKLAGLKARGKPLIEVLAPRPAVTAESEYSSYQPPPAPEMDPKLGDKTPAYIEWMRKYKPQEAEQRYHNRKFSAEAQSKPSGDVDIPDEPKEVWM
jgi:hypothetical protein